MSNPGKDLGTLDLGKDLRYDKCVRCRDREPNYQSCLCSTCRVDWIRHDKRICSCCNTNNVNPGRELCSGCYELWSNSIPVEIWRIPSGVVEGLPLIPGKCPSCRVENVSRLGDICEACYENRSRNKSRLCASCGKKRPAPNSLICKDCFGALHQAETLMKKTKGPVGGPFGGSSSAVAHRPCPLGTNCKDFDERHLSSFSHHGVGVRKRCDQKHFGECTSSDPVHIRTFVHGRPNLDAIPLTRCNLRDPSDPLSTMLSDQFVKYYNADFMSNSLALLGKAFGYVQQENKGNDFNGMELNKIREWFLHHRCVIYCSKEDLLFAIRNGGFRSTMFIKSFWDSAEEITSAVIMNPLLLDKVQIRAGQPGAEEYRQFVILYVKRVRTKKSEEMLKANKSLAKLLADTPKITSEEMKRLDAAREKVRGSILNTEKYDLVTSMVEKTINESAEKLLTSVDDIDKDDKLRLKYSFSCAMGPSPECKEQCAVILRESIMGHPDFFMHPVSAWSYLEGVSHKNTGMNRVPYLGESKKWNDKAETNEAHIDFNREKLSPALPFWVDCMTYEWIARVHATEGTPISSITLDHIKRLWNKSSYLCLSEAHLPQIIDRHFWDRVVVTRSAAEYLKSDATGRQFFEMGGKGSASRHIIISSDRVEDVGKKVAQVMEAEGPTAYYPRGFTFGMNELNYFDEVPIPVRFPAVADLYIYFTAHSGGTFDMIFSNICDYYDYVTPRVTQTIRFSTVQKSIQFICLCSVTDKDPLDKPVERKEKCDEVVKNFSKGVDSVDIGGIHYRVALHFKEKKIRVSHSGVFYQYCHTSKEFNMPDSLGSGQFNYVSFCNADKSLKTTIWNLRFHPNPLEEFDYDIDPSQKPLF